VQVLAVASVPSIDRAATQLCLGMGQANNDSRLVNERRYNDEVSCLCDCRSLRCTTADAQCSGQPTAMICEFTSTAPTLDGDLSEWDNVVGIGTMIYQPGGLVEYPDGSVSYKCMYDETNIYFGLAIPGDYRFDPTENERCASVAAMFKIGANATIINMGGCPDAATGCDASGAAPSTCDDYRVDIGAHWELSSTEQGVTYKLNPTSGTGEDPVAELGDEYAVSPYCRIPDDDADAGNEWSGVRAHSNPVDREAGTYSFELSRLLTTASSKTDAQLVAGATYQFGIAFWDPFLMEDGWYDAGHYITGCASKFIDLTLKASTKAKGKKGKKEGKRGKGTTTKGGKRGSIRHFL
jgi:hypothetical protein